MWARRVIHGPASSAGNGMPLPYWPGRRNLSSADGIDTGTRLGAQSRKDGPKFDAMAKRTRAVGGPGAFAGRRRVGSRPPAAAEAAGKIGGACGSVAFLALRRQRRLGRQRRQCGLGSERGGQGQAADGLDEGGGG